MERPETAFEAEPRAASIPHATFSIRIPTSWQKEIDLIARKNGTKRNDIINQMLDWAIADQMKKLGEERK